MASKYYDFAKELAGGATGEALGSLVKKGMSSKQAESIKGNLSSSAKRVAGPTSKSAWSSQKTRAAMKANEEKASRKRVAGK